MIDYDKQLKIIDFGLSSFYNKSTLKTFCGSPCYAAPEIIEAKRPYNPIFADIWSCGVILYSMLCGHLPFCDADTHTLYKKVLTGNYKIPGHLSPAAKELIENLLVLTPKKRLSLQEIKKHKWFNLITPTLSYGLDVG
jgi:serine/threonine protein kinase